MKTDLTTMLWADPVIASLLVFWTLGIAFFAWRLVRSSRRDADAQRRKVLDQIMQAGTPTAPGIRTDRKRVG